MEILQLLGRQVLTQLECRRNLVDLTRATGDHAATEELLQQQTQPERLVMEMQERIRQSLNIETVLRTTVSEVRQFLQTDRVFIFRFEPDESGVAIVESVGDGWLPILGSKLKDPTWAATCIQLYKQNQIQATANIYGEELTQGYIDFLTQFQVRANLVAPIWQEEKLWGLLVANHCDSPRQWQQFEIDLLQQLATQLAIALQQSQLYQQTQYQLRREQALNRVSQTVRNSLDLQIVFSTAVFEIARLLQAQHAHIVQYLPQRQTWLNVASYRAIPDLPDPLGLEIPDAGNEIATRLKRLEVVRINDASTCSDEINQDYAQTFPGAWLLVPLHFGGVVWGSLGLVRNQLHSCWQEEEVELACAIADQLTLAIQQSTLFEQVQTELAERKQAEEALRQNEATLRSFYDSALMMMGIVELEDDDIRHISDNAATAKFFGLTPAAMANRLASEMGVPTTHIREWIEHYRSAERTRSPVHFVYPHNTAEGQRWLMAIVSLIEGTGSSCSRFAYVVEDITQRQQVELELRWKEALLRSLTDASPMAFYVVDNRTDTILYFNHHFCEIWGLEHLKEPMQRGELKNQDIIPYCLPLLADVSGFAASCQPLQSESNRCVVEDEIPFVDGRIIRRFSAQIRDDSERYFGRLYLFEDITERKSEQKSREQAALLDITTDAILVRSLSDQILFWNKGAQQLYGWQLKEVKGKKANKLLCKGTSSQTEVAMKTVLSQGQWQGELHKVSKDGKDIIVDSRWILIDDEAGKSQSIFTVDTDITEKKQLEAQFLRAQRLESLGTLASGMAHELNNVLTPVLMSVQLLEMKADEQSQRLLKTLEVNVKRGADLIKQVLAFARGIEGERTILQVQCLISEIEQIAKQTFSKYIEIHTDIAPDLWMVCGNATQLHQVLINLCINARDAMPDGGCLQISAANLVVGDRHAQMYLEAPVGNYVSITISDTGVGIPPEIIERIFEPFFTTKEVGQGTGLGLSTAIGIIRSHGGFIDVSSKVGQGSQFQVFLPAGAAAVETQLPSDLELPRGNGELVLVVDDDYCC